MAGGASDDFQGSSLTQLGFLACRYGELGGEFMIRSETLGLATNYLDRYLCARRCGAHDFSLAAVSAILLAFKVQNRARRGGFHVTSILTCVWEAIRL